MYDARKHSESGKLFKQMLFASLAGALAICALIIALTWPTPDQRIANQQVEYQTRLANAEAGIIALAFPEARTSNLQSSLMELDGAAYQKLENRLKQSRIRSEATYILTMELEALLPQYAHELAHASSAAFDAILERTRTDLQMALRTAHPACREANYVDLTAANTSIRSAAQLIVQASADAPAFEQYVIDIAALLIEAAQQGRENPIPPARLTRFDEAALESLIDTLKPDPHIAALLSAKQGRSQQGAQINVCEAGTTLITALLTLPQETKARLWADLVTGGEGLKRIISP